MATAPRKCALLIAGPTASGKSALALRLAAERNGVIINADASQVYRELSILTARPTRDELERAPHRLYGHVSGRDSYSAGRWLDEARKEIENAWVNGRLPILTGGTGLYFHALEQGLADVPPIPGVIRAKWRSFEGDLHAALSRLDAEAAGRLQPNDKQRIIRAIEVFEATGAPLAHWQEQARYSSVLGGAETKRILVQLPRSELYRRAEVRFDAMMAAGAIDEVKQLLNYDPSLPIMKAIGVRELAAHLRGELTLDAAIAKAKVETRRYIKRQLTWWRGRVSWSAASPDSW